MIDCPICGSPIVGRNKKYCSNRCGNVARNRKYHAIHKTSEDFKEAQRLKNKKHRSTPRGKYISHKHRAKQSGVAFRLSFEEWLSLWEPYLNLNDGVRYCMCRTADKGAYEIGNVRIDTARNNNLEARGLLHV